MADTLTVGIIGCGRMGQHYAEVYNALPDTRIVAIAEHNAERRKAVGERFGVRGLFADADDMYRAITPDVVAVVLPGKYIKQAVIASAEAGGRPEEARRSPRDTGLIAHAHCRLSTGIDCAIFGTATPYRGVDVWTQDALVRWDWAPPEIYQGLDAAGSRRRVDRPYSPVQYPRFTYLGTSILSFLDVVRHGGELSISGHDLRQSLEVAIAAKYSALWGNVPLSLPLADRSLSLLPGEYRWVGGDQAGRVQTYEEALHDELFPRYKG